MTVMAAAVAAMVQAVSVMVAAIIVIVAVYLGRKLRLILPVRSHYCYHSCTLSITHDG